MISEMVSLGQYANIPTAVMTFFCGRKDNLDEYRLRLERYDDVAEWDKQA